MNTKKTSRTKTTTPKALVIDRDAIKDVVDSIKTGFVSTKTEKVQAEQARLMGLFTGADANKLDFIRAEVQKLAWLNVSIVELQKEIDDTGSVVEYNHGGGQTGVTTNPTCKLLVDYQKLSNATFRALLPVLPEGVSDYDDFAEFRPDTKPLSQEEIERVAREAKELRLRYEERGNDREQLSE